MHTDCPIIPSLVQMETDFWVTGDLGRVGSSGVGSLVETLLHGQHTINV